ncbi:MAG: Hsp20/alpha crystallin family protein [Candidatus Desulfofervidaceae bacterium]|nr:Hsp20/alpha crystallin family protein [Candidatus Desulfofervidaceae bacterium]MDL1970135.1 Hsp20/alpha crystallin family protein [Candidatus Desulfofervidaceae bacterium]
MNPLTDIEKEMERLHQRVRILMDAFFQQTTLMPSLAGEQWIPDMDVFETEKELVVLIDVAGLDKENIKVTLEGSVLYVKGYREDRFHAHNRKYHQVEINYGPFERSYRLPCPVDTDEISATYRNGFLEIKLPKKKTTVVRKIKGEV